MSSTTSGRAAESRLRRSEGAASAAERANPKTTFRDRKVRPLTEQEMQAVRQFRDWLRHPLDPIRTDRLASTITTFQIAAHIARQRKLGNQAVLSQPTNLPNLPNLPNQQAAPTAAPTETQP